MKPKLAIVFLFIVLAPLAVVGWLGARFAHSEREMIAHRFEQLAVERLREIDSGIASTVEKRKRELVTQLNGVERNPEALRALSKESPIATQFFLMGDNDELIYPAAGGELSNDENHFLLRTADVWRRGEISSATGGENTGQGKGRAPSVAQDWHTWYWGDGVHLLFWRRDASETVVGAELNRARLTADILEALPDTAPDAEGPLYVLVDSAGKPIYQWGPVATRETARGIPLATLALKAPLAAWHLEYYSAEALPGTTSSLSVLFNLTSGLLLLAVITVILAVYFYREHSRETREARQRVTFTNQVSHELKTPLTNIRMYAELLDDHVDSADEKSRKYLAVILSESQRLSRLIGNVLSFGKGQRRQLSIHLGEGVVDDTIRTVCDHFEPALSQRGVQIQFDGHAAGSALFDRDALEQILGNLLSNVEKYARGADNVRIESRRNGDTVAITVADNGPGIAPGDRNRIFEAFYRGSDKLTDGVAGAGIGLTIARELARLHGGDLTLEPSASGACFKITIATRPVPSERAS